jgi:predicted O-methyltransferase YrrM
MDEHDVDAWLTERLIGTDPALDAILAANAAAGLRPIDVSPLQGKFLHLIARAIGARRVLEIGTLGGYSTLWLARAVGEAGRVVTLELQPRNAAVARANLDRAGVTARVEVRVGAALDLLPAVEGPFDLVFIDADKANQDAYLAWALKLARPGAVIIGENVVGDGWLRTPTRPIPTSAACSASSTSSPPTPASAPPPSRRPAAKAGTALHLRWSTSFFPRFP